jgi:hypothetical protein
LAWWLPIYEEGTLAQTAAHTSNLHEPGNRHLSHTRGGQLLVFLQIGTNFTFWP